MALSYVQLYNAVAGDAALRARVTVAIWNTARAYFIEAVGTANHAQHLLYAKETLTNPERAATMVMSALATDPTVIASGTDMTDAALQTLVDGISGALARDWA